MRTLVIYAYHESPGSRENLAYFVKHGMEEANTHYVLVVNGGVCTVPLGNKWDRIASRENTRLDFGAWQYALYHLNTNAYTLFLFVNATVRGPFGRTAWLRPFQELLNDTTLLVGLTVNICTNEGYARIHHRAIVPHVQSMFWGTNRRGFELLRPHLLRPFPDNKSYIIAHYEIGNSLRVLDAGYNITCILPSYRHDYRRHDLLLSYAKSNPQAYAAQGDLWKNRLYFGRNLDPNETIFFKTNRGIPLRSAPVVKPVARLEAPIVHKARRKKRSVRPRIQSSVPPPRKSVNRGTSYSLNL